MYNRRHCYPHKSTDSARQKPETHAPIPNSNPSVFGLQTRCFVLSTQWLCFSLISYITVAVEKYIFQVKKDQGKGERVRGCLMPTTRPLVSLLALTHSMKAAAAVMLVDERWTHLSVVAGRDPKDVKPPCYWKEGREDIKRMLRQEHWLTLKTLDSQR